LPSLIEDFNQQKWRLNFLRTLQKNLGTNNFFNILFLQNKSKWSKNSLSIHFKRMLMQNDHYKSQFLALSWVATVVFNVRLLHVFAFSNYLPWLPHVCVITLKTKQHAVNARWKRLSQLILRFITCWIKARAECLPKCLSLYIAEPLPEISLEKCPLLIFS